MVKEISQLSCLQCGQDMDVVRLSCQGCGLSIAGRLALTPLVRLDPSEQAFVTAFVREHGDIRKMERLFGVGYPTIKSRLNDIATKLEGSENPAAVGEILDRIESGELDVGEALKLLDRQGVGNERGA